VIRESEDQTNRGQRSEVGGQSSESILKFLRVIVTTALCVVAASAPAADKNVFEGTLTATFTRAGTEATHFVFTRKGNQLRIENTTNKLEPINIVDLEAKKLTIVYPHNTTFVHVDLTKTQMQSGAPPTPPGFPTPPNIGTSQIGARPGPNPPSPGFGATGISPPPGFPPPPPMPSMPKMPVGGAPTGAGVAPAFPNPMPPLPGYGAPGMMPPIPPMPGMFGAAELKKTDKTKKVQGFDCALYTVSERGENFEIWAMNDSALFPFRLTERDYLGRRFGPQMIEETWPELLRNKSLFPFEASLKMEPNAQERLTFKIDKTEKKKIENDKLFAPPENYIEIQAPQF
jgi:hypothetical protein